MIGRRKLSEVKTEVAALLRRLPGGSRAWLAKEIKSAKGDPKRDLETLEMLCTALGRAAQKPKAPLRSTKRRAP